MTYTLFRAAALFLSMTLVWPGRIFAYETELSSEAVREAYFLGQRKDEKMAQFLEPYGKHLPLPEKGPYVSEIKLFTPYAQVVDTSRQRAAGYSVQQAERDYRDRGDTILVFVRIQFTSTYGYAQAVASANRAAGVEGATAPPQDFWKDFREGLSLGEKWIEPLSQHGEPVYGEETGLVGAVVWLEFSARDVASENGTVEVFTPGDGHVVSSFDLSQLR